jgi:hypothetical protein
MSFTLDLAGCLAADGISAAKVIKLPISADDDASDTSVQNLSVCLPGCNPNETEELQGPGNGGAQGPQSIEQGFLHRVIDPLGVGASGL